jgi:hypothetical protein
VSRIIVQQREKIAPEKENPAEVGEYCSLPPLLEKIKM